MTINNRIINVAICVSLPLFGNAAPKMQPQGSENAATSNLQATEDLAGEPSMDTEAARKLAVWNADRKKLGLLPISYKTYGGICVRRAGSLQCANAPIGIRLRLVLDLV